MSIIDKIDKYLEEKDDRDFGRADWVRKQINTDWEEKTISTAERDRHLQKEDDKIKEKMKKRSMKESVDESKGSKKEAKKNLNGLKAKLKKYPDMPEDVQAAIKELIAFYEKELRTFTYDDVFPKD
jgi:hypothetical protein